MKATSPITEEQFTQATGCAPAQDDLERCNCDKAGEAGHSQCGWNYTTDLPCFMSMEAAK